MSEPNKYVRMMLDEATALEQTADRTPFETESWETYRAELLASATDWRAAAEAFEELLEACRVGSIAIDVVAKMNPEFQSHGLASTHRVLLAALAKARGT